MDAKLRTTWIETLRSGKYPQATGVLCDSYGKYHCCLGVLLRVQDFDILDRYNNDDERATSILPKSFRAGLDHEQMVVLSRMNDKGASFEKIADYIEANIPADAAVKDAE